VTDALLSLADLDQDVVRARHAVEHPPSASGLSDAQVTLAALRAEKRELDDTRTPLSQRAEALDRDVTAARERAATISARLDASTGAGRELEAMASERDALLDRAAHLEDELLDVLEALEPMDARDAELRALAQDAHGRAEQAASGVDAERAEAHSRLAQLAQDRPALVATVDAGLLARYEAIARRNGGVGAARLVDGRCGACRVTVPSVLIDQLAHSTNPGFVVVCDECGRLIAR
jgi:predicted  nucleic acid-binding Zn-ribbon protein